MGGSQTRDSELGSKVRGSQVPTTHWSQAGTLSRWKVDRFPPHLLLEQRVGDYDWVRGSRLADCPSSSFRFVIIPKNILIGCCRIYLNLPGHYRMFNLLLQFGSETWVSSRSARVPKQKLYNKAESSFLRSWLPRLAKFWRDWWKKLCRRSDLARAILSVLVSDVTGIVAVGVKTSK